MIFYFSVLKKINMSYPKIYMPCYGNENQCFHWFCELRGNKAILVDGRTLISNPHLSQELRLHISEKIENMSENGQFCWPENGQFCWPENGQNSENPQKLLSKADFLLCKANEPQSDDVPTNDKRPNFKLSCVNSDEFLHDVSYMIGSDCWSVFSRDKYHNVHKLYFFFKR